MFQNENTFAKLSAAGKEEEFHSKYENAVEQVGKNLGQAFPMIIGGKPVFAVETFDDISPSNLNLVVARFQKGTKEEARKAIAEAKKAFESWSRMPYQDRVRIYRKAADIASEQKFKLAAEMSFENGKNRFEAIADIDEGIDFLRYYAEQLEANKGFTVELGKTLPNEHTKSILKPYGVWSVIAPFNFPFAIATGMSAGASIVGNTVVLKPASDTPLLSYELCKMLEQAGLPPGVYNFVTGPGSTVGSELIKNPEVSGVVFTGSWDVGSKSLSEFEAVMPRPFIAEMGGKNATIITQNADVEKAAEGVMRGAFGYGGQKCSACSRVYVHRNLKDEFVKKLVEKTSKLKVGEPTQRETFLGPLINESAYKNYQRYVEEAKSGAKIAFGGKVFSNKANKGYFVEPTIVTDIPQDHKLVKTELFVPILTVETFEALDEAIKRVNAVDYGLTSGIFSKDQTEINRFFNEVQAGVLYANRTSGSTTGAVVGAQSFVGWKRSGSSGKGTGAPYYLQQFLREQSQTSYD
ncbi:MAG: aldehyde dehydrogenase family protein [Nitrososphaerota archaeon]|nr:aldehyde dehydrogenase family protein [Nitrososphaerota archaeon]